MNYLNIKERESTSTQVFPSFPMAFPLAPGATQLSRETKRFECKRKGKYFVFWHEELTGRYSIASRKVTEA